MTILSAGDKQEGQVALGDKKRGPSDPCRSPELCLKLLIYTYEPRHEISNNVVYVTSTGSDQPAHTRSLIRAFASRLIYL